MQQESLETSPPLRPSLKRRIGVVVGGVVCAAAAFGSLYFLHQAESQPPTSAAEVPVDHTSPAVAAVAGLAMGGVVACIIGRDKPQPAEAPAEFPPEAEA